jgi:hypothetical protein
MRGFFSAVDKWRPRRAAWLHSRSLSFFEWSGSGKILSQGLKGRSSRGSLRGFERRLIPPNLRRWIDFLQRAFVDAVIKDFREERR